jgi:hypothetical protein
MLDRCVGCRIGNLRSMGGGAMTAERLAPMMSSAIANWRTPPELLTALKAGGFDFTLDAAESASTPKRLRVAPHALTPRFDSLANDWPTHTPGKGSKPHRDVWLNPPYGRGVGRWIAQARQQSIRLEVSINLRASLKRQARPRAPRVVLLLAARPDTAAWHEECSRAAEVCFLRGRLRFMLPDGTPAAQPAPFPSALVVFDGEPRAIGECPRVSWWDYSGGQPWAER